MRCTLVWLVIGCSSAPSRSAAPRIAPDAGESGAADSDQDQIADIDDLCPNEPETFNSLDDGDGCPDRDCVPAREPSHCVLERLFFRHGSSVIDPTVALHLDDLAAQMIQVPAIELLAVRGHRTAREAARLSALRATAVAEALIRRGVARERMHVVDLEIGETQGRTEDAQRRVDFTIERQRVREQEADDFACTSFGAVNLELSPDQRSPPCH